MKSLFSVFVFSVLSYGITVHAQNYSWTRSNQTALPVAGETQQQSIAIGISASESALHEPPNEYWTKERLRNAKHIDLPRASADSYPSTEIMESYNYSESISEPGRAPEIKVKRSKNKLFEPIRNEINPDDSEMLAYSAEDITPYSVGTAGAYFTSSRVSPAPTAQNSWPFIATGKLFFSDSIGNQYTCTASVVKPRLILTAGHCVYDAVSKKWYTNFKFIPAFHNGGAPYGQWYWAWAATTNNWVNGGGKLPNSGDFALIEMQDNSLGQKLGNITGYYGYRLNALSPNHVTIFGYPASYDSASWLHRVDSQSYKATFVNTVEFGADMTGGSSGGPFLENFGDIASGQSVSGFMNALVGVVSYGPNDTAVRSLGSSILDSQFTNSTKTGILDVACVRRAGNC